MCTYLTKRGATYYFRRKVPDELRPAMGGKVEFMVSLGTKDRDQAKRLIQTYTPQSQIQLDAARAKLDALAGASPVAPAAVPPWVSQADMEHIESARQEDAESEHRKETRTPLLRRLFGGLSCHGSANDYRPDRRGRGYGQDHRSGRANSSIRRCNESA